MMRNGHGYVMQGVVTWATTPVAIKRSTGGGSRGLDNIDTDNCEWMGEL